MDLGNCACGCKAIVEINGTPACPNCMDLKFKNIGGLSRALSELMRSQEPPQKQQRRQADNGLDGGPETG